MHTRRIHHALSVAALGVLAALLGAACASKGDTARPVANPSQPAALAAADPSTTEAAPRAGAVRMQFKFGPITIQPGQNNIKYSHGQVPKPAQDGWIVRIAPNLRRADGSVPGVDVIHLHHGVWLNQSAHDSTIPFLPERFYAAGEEKTILTLPVGYGYAYHASDRWTINYMIHNLLPAPDQVWITYDIDFIPADSPAAAGLRSVRPIWMDVQNGSVYPVFDALKGSGKGGLFTYPDDVPSAYGTRQPLNQWTVDRAGVLIGTAGHLHPGGVYDDLNLQRAGQAGAAHLFRSDAHYYEPAGAVSWDVAMTATPPDWRVAVHQGDVLSVSATYDVSHASWYESMGIMVVWMSDGTEGADPFQTHVDVAGVLTHGHLPENNNHGGKPANLPDPRTLPSGPQATTVGIKDFTYALGDFSEGPTDVPTVRAGQPLAFSNADAPVGPGIWHSITACQAPCNASTGIAFPLANADWQFDSGQLGTAGPPTAGRVTWSTPTNLPDGTYTYFCRIHPFMRGAFRVVSG